MKKILIILIVMFGTQLCHAENDINKVRIDNQLTHCLQINKQTLISTNNLLLLHSTWEMKSNIGECGCKSAVVSYHVYENNNKLISLGKFTGLDKDIFYFVISSDVRHARTSDYLLTISCAN